MNETEFVIFKKDGDVLYTSNLRIKRSISTPFYSCILKTNKPLYLDWNDIFTFFEHDCDLGKCYWYYAPDKTITESESEGFYKVASIAIKKYV